MEGWIKLHRKLLEHSLWQNEVFTRGQAWIDLLLSVNHKEREIIIGSQFLMINRGSTLTSELKLSQRWKWSRKKVRTFLEVLEKSMMITKESTSKYTIITIENYDFYQSQDTEGEQVKNISRTTMIHSKNRTSTSDEQQENINGTQTRMNKNIKNDKNERNKTYVQQTATLWFLYPNKKGKDKAMKKLPKLIEQYGYEVIEKCIEKYAKEVEGKDIKYVKHGSTFFNGAFMDYLETVTQEDEWEEYLWEDPMTGEQEIRRRKKV